MAQAVPNQMVHILEQLIHRRENFRVGGGAASGGHAILRDEHGRTEREARKDYVDFLATALLPREPRATPSGVSRLEPQARRP